MFILEHSDILFGFIDNFVLALCAIGGIDLDKKLGGSGIHGAVYGGLFGNSLSDFLAAQFSYGFLPAVEITIGCLIVVPPVWIYYKFKNGNNRGGITQQWKLKKQKSYYSGPIERSMF